MAVDPNPGQILDPNLMGGIIFFFLITSLVSLIVAKTRRDRSWEIALQLASGVACIYFTLVTLVLSFFFDFDRFIGLTGLGIGLFGIGVSIFNNVKNQEDINDQLRVFLSELRQDMRLT